MDASFRHVYERLLHRCLEEVQRAYGPRLVTFAVSGSVGRGTPRPDSDIDLVVLAEGLPPGRLARLQAFEPVEDALEPDLRAARAQGVSGAACSPGSWRACGSV